MQMNNYEKSPPLFSFTRTPVVKMFIHLLINYGFRVDDLYFRSKLVKHFPELLG